MIRDRLADELRLKSAAAVATEVRCPAGRIDLLSSSPNAIVEVKTVLQWKHALGQVLSYQIYYPHLTPIVYLFGRNRDFKRLDPVITEVCGRYDVRVRFVDAAAATDYAVQMAPLF